MLRLRRKSGKVAPLVFFILEVTAVLIIYSIVARFEVSLATYATLFVAVVYIITSSAKRLGEKMERKRDEG